MTPHTVAPWAIDGEGATVALVLAPPGRYGVGVAITAPSVPLSHRFADGEVEANAALVLASPDLLAAARVALEAMRAGIFCCTDSQAAATAAFVTAALERAVAAAEGATRG